jgi:hypothetical protein
MKYKEITQDIDYNIIYNKYKVINYDVNKYHILKLLFNKLVGIKSPERIELNHFDSGDMVRIVRKFNKNGFVEYGCMFEIYQTENGIYKVSNQISHRKNFNYNTSHNVKLYICDNFDGLIELLNDNNII